MVNITEEQSFLRKKIQEKLEDSFLRRASIKKEKIKPNMDIKKTLDENIFIFGHIILDMHEEFKIEKLEYEALKPFENFKTPEDIISYILERK